MCFPQFGMMGAMPTQHGFVRNVSFTVEDKKDWSVRMVRMKGPRVQQPAHMSCKTLVCVIGVCDWLRRDC